MKAAGEFQVELKPLEAYAQGSVGITLGRMSIDKTFSGDLSGSSQGEMLTVLTPVEGSAVYVAIEQVRGSLRGQTGGFALAHYGVASQGDNRLVLEIVPDSGTGQLKGISGEMAIRIEDGKHFYELDYALA